MAVMLHCLIPTAWVPPLSPPTASPVLGNAQLLLLRCYYQAALVVAHMHSGMLLERGLCISLYWALHVDEWLGHT